MTRYKIYSITYVSSRVHFNLVREDGSVATEARQYLYLNKSKTNTMH